jgi:hypothetical protein
MTGVKSPYVERDAERLKRLTMIIQTEGDSLTNKVIKERFPWAGAALVKSIRDELNVKPPSESGMLSTKDMSDAKPAKFDRFGSKGNGQ